MAPYYKPHRAVISHDLPSAHGSYELEALLSGSGRRFCTTASSAGWHDGEAGIIDRRKMVRIRQIFRLPRVRAKSAGRKIRLREIPAAGPGSRGQHRGRQVR